MKSVFFLVVMMCLMSSLVFSQKKEVVKPAFTQNNGLPNLSDTLQYAIGVQVGKWISSNGFQINNGTIFLKGIEDVFQKGKLLLPDSLINPLVNAYQRYLQKEKSVKLEQQLFASLKDKPGMGVFPNGVHYLILKNGTGQHPTTKDSIILNIQAKLPDGSIIEDSYQSKKPFRATVTSFFPGLNETLLQMQEGARWQLFIPASLAYGDKGTELIPSGSALILDVELLQVHAERNIR